MSKVIQTQFLLANPSVRLIRTPKSDISVTLVRGVHFENTSSLWESPGEKFETVMLKRIDSNIGENEKLNFFWC
jgi:hypothetical protein